MNRYTIYITSFLFLFCTSLQAQLVITVAGQPEIPGNFDGLAFEATFNNPHGIAIDQNGNIYTADRWSHIIRKITPNAEVTTLAGQAGISGDADGTGSEALFNEPWGLCTDKAGNVLVADTRNNKIRKITPEGVVTTIAGSGNFGTSNGIGLASTFGNPTGIECDEDGNIYVADHLTHIIRKITPNGVVSTIAGTPYVLGFEDGPGGLAKFARPYGLTLDLDGNILVADEWNHRIRRIDAQGIVSTVAGSGVVGSSDGLGANASFNYPWDMTVDSLGNIFVADGYNYLIRKITHDGLVTAFAGTLETTGAVDGIGNLASFSGATAIAVSPLTKEIYIGDAYNNLVRKIIDLNQGISVLTVDQEASTVCEGETVEVYVSPDIYNNYFFYVDGDLVQSTSQSTFSFVAEASGIYQISAAVQDNGSTFQSNPKTISVLALPQPNISMVGESPFFEGDSITLIASQSESYFWSTGDSTPTIVVKESGDYFVDVLGSNGCYGSSETVAIEVLADFETPLVLSNGSTTICEGDFVELQSENPETNQWFLNGWPIEGATEQLLQATAAGLYQVQVQSPTGVNILSEPIEVQILPKSEFDFIANRTVILEGETIEFQVIQDDLSQIEWLFEDANSMQNSSTAPTAQHTYLLAGEYDVALVVSNTAGCRDTMYKENFIQVFTPEEIDNAFDDLFIPTAFTPNGDGVNDQFFVRGSNISDVQLMVFNHWGQQVFASKNPEEGWNGEYNGQPVQNGNYTYCAQITQSNGAKKELTGHVTVLR